MTRYKDMTGQTFGLLTAREFVGKDRHNNALWRCTCECGGEKIANRKRLVYGDTRSCGCLHEKRLANQRFGRLLVLEKAGTNNHRNNLWKCKCDCGNTVDVTASALVSGCTKSCGCLMIETSRKTFTTHGESNTRLYEVWQGMKARCFYKHHSHYKHYGGRGITVCDEWLDFSNFSKWAYENGYDENAPRNQCTIDRIDVNGNYEPNNCRWADAKEQAVNKRPRAKGYKRGKYKKKLATV